MAVNPPKHDSHRDQQALIAIQYSLFSGSEEVWRVSRGVLRRID